MRKTISHYIYDECIKEGVESIYIGLYGLLSEAYCKYIDEQKPKRFAEHPARKLEACMNAVRNDKKRFKFNDRYVKSCHFSARETWHPLFELVKNNNTGEPEKEIK